MTGVWWLVFVFVLSCVVLFCSPPLLPGSVRPGLPFLGLPRPQARLVSRRPSGFRPSAPVWLGSVLPFPGPVRPSLPRPSALARLLPAALPASGLPGPALAGRCLCLRLGWCRAFGPGVRSFVRPLRLALCLLPLVSLFPFLFVRLFVLCLFGCWPWWLVVLVMWFAMQLFRLCARVRQDPRPYLEIEI